MSFKDAMLNSILITVSPSTTDEVMMLGDALRLWQQHPELRHELTAKLDVKPDRLLMRVALALALIKYAPDLPEDLKRCTEPGCPGADGGGCIHRG